MTEDLTTKIMERIDRRRFLRRSAAGIAAIVLGLFGVATPASAIVHYKCCFLCFNPSGAVYGSCASSPRYWCWLCSHTDGNDYSCCEQFQAGATCQKTCTGVVLSTSRKWGT